MIKLTSLGRPVSYLLTMLVLSSCHSTVHKSASQISLSMDGKSYQALHPLDLTLPEITELLNTRQITSQALVGLYLQRIEQLDQRGPKLRSIISVNPQAMQEAKLKDQLSQQGKTTGALHGVPILLKDNIETKDNLATTAGALALSNNFTGRDSPLVTGLRNQGAIILGKTNLSQWANFRSESSMSGWSAIGGQVRNPHMLDRNPCGSSSGSGAAIAASLAAAAVGTETNGSIICPAHANGVVGFKPSVGLVSQQFIIPISKTQDTAGPMTKSVKGAAMMLNAMINKNTSNDFTGQLNKAALKGKRIGILRFAQGKSQAIIKQFERALSDMQKAGAILVEIDQQPKLPDSYWQQSYQLLKYEFKHGINEYLATTDPTKVTTRNLLQLIQFNNQLAEQELVLFDQSIFESASEMASIESTAYKTIHQSVVESSKSFIDSLLKQHQVSALVSPSGPLIPRIDPINGDVWPNSWPGAGSYAARAGYPHISVPMGSVFNLPVGVSFIGSGYQDAEILAIAYAYEQHSKRRTEPRYLQSAELIPAIEKAMSGQTKK